MIYMHLNNVFRIKPSDIHKYFQTNKIIKMVKFTTMTKFFLVLAIFLGFNLNFADAQSETKEVAAEEAKMRVLGDPGEGLFFVHYDLPKAAKKVIWTVTDEKGQVLIKEKFKKLKAGKNKFKYNYKNAPDGLHKFKIVADGEEIAEIEVLKKKK